MDYKFKQGTFTLATMAILMVISVVVIVNWQTISRRINGSKKLSEAEISAAVEYAEEAFEVAETKGNFNGTQIGNDLYAWMNDKDFFDSGDRVEIMEQRIVTEKTPVKKINNEGTGREER